MLLAAVLLGWGAWQQVAVGWGSHSAVMGYPLALLPLPALLCSAVIGVCALVELLRGTPLTSATRPTSNERPRGKDHVMGISH